MFIDAYTYTSESVFKAELDRLFSQRLYVGTVADFQQVDSYKSFRIGKVAFTVRRTSGGAPGDAIKAFSNVCLHRSSLIDPDAYGQREFRCRYHGWAYDENGSLRSTPLADEACIHAKTLKQYPVSVIDGLVFVATNGVSPCASKIDAAVGKIGAPVAPSSPFHKGSLLHKCNWKVLVENVCEGYHLSFVHPATFVSGGFVSTSKYEWGYDEYTCWHTITPKDAASKTASIQRLSLDATVDFMHAYVFPNLFMTTINALVGFRSYMIPVNVDTTLLEWELYELPALLALTPAVREHMRGEAIKFASTSLLEDKPLVESCQAGLTSQISGVQLQPREDRVKRFHSYYMEQMANV